MVINMDMRKKTVSLEEIKKDVAELRGKGLKISVNKGRKKIVKYDGEITEVYPSVFTLKIYNDLFIKSLSCSYSDVICGDIRMKESKTLPVSSAAATN